MVRSFSREHSPSWSLIILQILLTNGKLFTQPPYRIAFGFYYVLKQKPLKMGVFLSRHNHNAILKLEFLLGYHIYISHETLSNLFPHPRLFFPKWQFGPMKESQSEQVSFTQKHFTTAQRTYCVFLQETFSEGLG